MNLSLIRISFAFFWLFLGVVIFLRHQLVPQWAANQQDSNLTLMAVFALALAFWNFYRWKWMSQRSKPTREQPNPLQPKPKDERPEEYIPEFDFSAKNPDEKMP